uniref:Uncharacterized protein n=1 Tax=Gopherus agassizii TaxID=38772 RepID=A0A452ITP9_9SAUR
MAWHQGLNNPIPDFNQLLTTTVTLSQERRRGTPNAPVTWGQIKSLSQQAERLLEQQEKEKTPENLLTALIACLNGSVLAGKPPDDCSL